MADIYTKEKRSYIMSRVKGNNSKPEVTIRKILHRLGYRYRLKSKKLPGKPDIVLSKHKKVIFVNGCFWHGHESCNRAKLPTTNKEFWIKKISETKNRDKKVIDELQLLGWNSLTIWQCEIKKRNINTLVEMIENFMMDY